MTSSNFVEVKPTNGFHVELIERKNHDANTNNGVKSTDLLIKNGTTSPLRSSTHRTQVVFRDICYSIRSQDPKTSKIMEKSILKNIHGTFEPGRCTAIMGASGAGKTSLLNVLAGHFTQGSMTGQITVNGQPFDHHRIQRMSGFVHQDDVILDTMTVTEALNMSAHLRLPDSVPESEKQQRVDEIIALLRLHKVKDTVIGGKFVKGCSGGEKRRVSVGMEMVTNPPLLFLDEPTTGLDTYTAYSLIQLLRRVARLYSRTIVFTIHQPSSEIFHLFDDLLLLADGQTMYHGPAAGAVDHFNALHYPCPDFVNPADFIFTNVLYTLKNTMEYRGVQTGGALPDSDWSRKQKDKFDQQQAEEKKRIEGLLDAWQHSDAYEKLMKQVNSPTPGYVPSDSELRHFSTSSFATQFRLLFNRSWRNQQRNRMLSQAQFVQTTVIATIVGLIYLQLSDNQASVQNRVGAIFFIAVNPFMSCCMANLGGFGGERAVFVREYRSHMYSLPAFFFSRLCVIIPINIMLPCWLSVITYFLIGFRHDNASHFFIYLLITVCSANSGTLFGIFICCAIPNLSVALAVGPMMIMPLMIFSGFYVNLDSIGPWFSWIQYISPIKYSFTALMLNEFTGLSLTYDTNTPRYKNGDDVLTQFSLDNKQTIAQNILILLAFYCGLVFLSIFMLRRTSKK